MDTEKRKIVECIFNIDMISRHMSLTIFENIKAGFKPGSVIHGNMISYFTIQICTILDELDIIHSYAKKDEYLQDTLNIISPITRALKKFTGFRKARNIILAHYNRDKQGNFSPWWNVMKELKLPRGAENKDINVWVSMLNSILVSRYYDELKDFTDFVQKDYEDYREWEKQDLRDALNRDHFKGVLDEVEKRAYSKGMNNIKI